MKFLLFTVFKISNVPSTDLMAIENGIISGIIDSDNNYNQRQILLKYHEKVKKEIFYFNFILTKNLQMNDNYREWKIYLIKIIIYYQYLRVK